MVLSIQFDAVVVSDEPMPETCLLAATVVVVVVVIVVIVRSVSTAQQFEGCAYEILTNKSCSCSFISYFY